MILKIKQFFETRLKIEATTPAADIEHRLKLTCSILLLEMIHVDEKAHETEESKIREILQLQFGLNKNETEELLEIAHQEKLSATDYYKFTSLINEHYSQEQKIELVEQLWRIAYADNVLDKFEEHLVRKLADLLHVPHKNFIQTKHRSET